METYVKKLLNGKEIPLKSKHVRSLVLKTWNSYGFENPFTKIEPYLKENSIIAYKGLTLMSILLQEGEPSLYLSFIGCEDIFPLFLTYLSSYDKITQEYSEMLIDKIKLYKNEINKLTMIKSYLKFCNKVIIYDGILKKGDVGKEDVWREDVGKEDVGCNSPSVQSPEYLDFVPIRGNVGIQAKDGGEASFPKGPKVSGLRSSETFLDSKDKIISERRIRSNNFVGNKPWLLTGCRLQSLIPCVNDIQKLYSEITPEERSEIDHQLGILYLNLNSIPYCKANISIPIGYESLCPKYPTGVIPPTQRRERSISEKIMQSEGASSFTDYRLEYTPPGGTESSPVKEPTIRNLKQNPDNKSDGSVLIDLSEKIAESGRTESSTASCRPEPVVLRTTYSENTFAVGERLYSGIHAVGELKVPQLLAYSNIQIPPSSFQHTTISPPLHSNTHQYQINRGGRISQSMPELPISRLPTPNHFSSQRESNPFSAHNYNPFL